MSEFGNLIINSYLYLVEQYLPPYEDVRYPIIIRQIIAALS